MNKEEAKRLSKLKDRTGIMLVCESCNDNVLFIPDKTTLDLSTLYHKKLFCETCGDTVVKLVPVVIYYKPEISE